MSPELVGRTGLARILKVSENSARSIEARGEISPTTFVDGRALFSAHEARQLCAAREARRAQTQADRTKLSPAA
jgi:hypothetical protein